MMLPGRPAPDVEPDYVQPVREAFEKIRGQVAFDLLVPEHSDLYFALCNLVEIPAAREQVRRALDRVAP